VQIRETQATEEQLLARRLETAATGKRRMKAVIVLGNALAVLVLLVAGFVIHRESGKRNLAEQNLKHANERLERRTSQLWETNIELESFTYSVAHDLRAPLRHMTGCSNTLTEDYGPQLDGEGRRYLGKIADSAQKMGRLVDDLVNLSQIGRQVLSLQATPLDALSR
jgi:signal transduction histidine kinase